MLTQDAFEGHKQDYTILRKTPVLDEYHNETNQFIPGGTVHCMWVPVSDEATITAYGEKVNSMLQAVIYDETEIDAHDQIEIKGNQYEVISIKEYPSYRLLLVNML